MEKVKEKTKEQGMRVEKEGSIRGAFWILYSSAALLSVLIGPSEFLINFTTDLKPYH